MSKDQIPWQGDVQASGENAGPASQRRLMQATRRIIHVLDVQSKRSARETGLTTTQLIVLEAVGDHGEVTSKRLSQEVSLSLPTLVTVLDKLEGKGLIERYRSATDRRIVHNRLTQAGRGKLDGAPPILSSEMVEGFNALEPGAREQLIEALECLGGLYARSRDKPASGGEE